MKKTISRMLGKLSYLISELLFILRHFRYDRIFRLFSSYTMIPRRVYVTNLRLAEAFKQVKGCVVECGTWRGGMIGGIAKLFSDDRKYYLFDSFEGLPTAELIDGEGAMKWQQNTDSPTYYDNCRTEMSYAESAMKISGVKNVSINKGWFSETLPDFSETEKIAILRLDGDWYNSTMECLDNLYSKVVVGGIIIIDDYYAWDGCARAVHDFLSKHSLSDRILQKDNSVCYIVKIGEQFVKEEGVEGAP